MHVPALGFFAGVVGLHLLPDLPHPLWIVAGSALSFLARKRLGKLPLWITIGFTWAWLRADYALEQRLPADFDGEEVVVTGHIVNLPVKAGRAWRFLFDIERIDHGGQSQPLHSRVRLRWYERESAPATGGYWQLRVRLKQPHGFANPGGFDYEGWLFRRGIHATGYVRHSDTNQRLREPEGYLVQRLRAVLDGYLEALLPSSGNRSLIKALVIGKRDGVSSEQWEVLRQTGTGHLMAISGLHIGLVAGLVFALIRRGWSWFPRLTERYAATRAAAVAALITATIYALVAGFTISTQRALIMVAVVSGGCILGRRLRAGHSLLMALLAVLIYDPSSACAPGFWLSFGAVGLIAYLWAGRLQTPRGLREKATRLIRLQLALAWGLVPLSLILFQQAAWIAPLANLVAIPWIGIGVVPAALLGTLLAPLSAELAGVCLAFSVWFLDLLWEGLEFLTILPASLWQHARPATWTWLPAAVGLLWLLAPKGVPGRGLGLLLLLPMALAKPGRPDEGAVWFTLLDVGQGLAAVVATRDHVLVFDTGPRFNEDFDTGKAVVAPYLISRGRTAVDRLIVSHGDNDHIGGAESLGRRLPIHSILTSVPEQVAWSSTQRCRTGQHWRWNGVAFRILHPSDKYFARGNNGSCVLHIQSAGGVSLLIPGDIEAGAERYLLSQMQTELRSTVLVAPHHGSLTSSLPRFIEQVAPDFVLFPSGYRNRFGFPRPKVVARYAAAGATLFDTGRYGAIELRLAADVPQVEVSTYRQRYRRYWHHRTVPNASLNPYDKHGLAGTVSNLEDWTWRRI